MNVAGLSLPLVFAAGVVSFISPCVLPLLPGYLSTVSGVSFEEMSARERGVGRPVALASGLFFVGFLAVFIALGASASIIGGLLRDNRLWLDRVSGGLIVVFGLTLLGLSWGRTGAAGFTGRIQAAARRRGGPVALGVAFAFCWTPCVGPILATVLTVAGASASLKSGVLLLLVYGLGLAVPFVVIGFGFTRALAAFKRLQRHYRAVERSGGVLLVGMGALLASGYLFVLNIYAQHVLTWLHLNWWTSL